MIRRGLLQALPGACLGGGALEPAQTRTVMGGMNVAGLEFAPHILPGRIDVDFVAPSAGEIAYYREAGARVIRLPFLWERLQPQLRGPLDPAYARFLDAAIRTAAPLRIVLDAHQFGRRRIGGDEAIIGEHPSVTARDFAEFWARLAERYRTNPSVIFGLMNEPHDQDMGSLVATQNQVIAAIRATGADQLLLASGNAWSGAHSWNASGNAEAMLDIRDPMRNFAFDVHQYLNGDSSGADGACAPNAGQRLRPFAEWARAHRKRAFLGEFGVGDSGACLQELAALLDDVTASEDVWLGWTYWAGGAWWPENYPLRIRPTSLHGQITDRPQMRVLRRYLR